MRSSTLLREDDSGVAGVGIGCVGRLPVGVGVDSNGKRLLIRLRFRRACVDVRAGVMFSEAFEYSFGRTALGDILSMSESSCDVCLLHGLRAIVEADPSRHGGGGSCHAPCFTLFSVA